MYRMYVDNETGGREDEPRPVGLFNCETGETFTGCKLGASLLHKAACENNSELVEELVNSGADINLIYKTVPALYIAVMFNNIEVVKMLIKHKCDLNAKSVELEQTALHCAASKGLMEMARIVCQNGANVNQRDRDGATPLMQGATNGELAVVDYLVQLGADINLANHRGLSPLAAAVQNGNGEIVQYLIQAGADVNLRDTQGNNALFHAVKGGQTSICQMLINAGTNVGIHNTMKEYPITVAAMYGNTPITNLLVNAGCDVNVVSKQGTPVYSAVERQHINVVKRLVMAGADVGKLGPNRRLPLVEALHQHTPSYDVIIELLRGGANIDAAVCECHTSPLNMIMAKCNVGSIGLLLQVDAKLTVADYKMEELAQFCPMFHATFTRLLNDNVTGLKGLCRKAIKNRIGTVYYKKRVESLPLPKQLQNYLLHYDVVPTQQFMRAHYEEYQAKKGERSVFEMAVTKPRMQSTKSHFRIVKS